MATGEEKEKVNNKRFSNKEEEEKTNLFSHFVSALGLLQQLKSLFGVFHQISWVL